MAISAKFEADFGQFVAEADKANASLTQIEGTSQTVASALSNVSEAAVDLAIGLTAMFSVREALAFLDTITQEARGLQILSAQTQINVEDLQILGAATREYGIDSEQLGKAIFQLGQRIAGGNASVVSGLALMGLSLEDVKNKHGEELFLMVEEAAGKLHGTIRDTAMADLYGARLGSSLGALSTGIGEAMDKARAMNTVMSKDAVAAAADYANAIERASTNLHHMAVEMIGPLLSGFNVVAEAQQKGASFWAIAAAMAKDAALSAAGFGTQTSNLADLLDKLNQKTDANAKSTGGAAAGHKAATVALTEEEQQQQFMATLQANAAVALTEQQLANLGHLKEIGELNAKNAAGIGVNEAQFKQYTESIIAATKATADLKKAQAEADAVEMAHYATTLKGLQEVAKARQAENTDYGAHLASIFQLDAAEQALAKTVFESLTSEKDRAKIVAESVNQHIALMTQEMAVQLKQAGVVNAAILAEFDAQVKLNAEWGRNASGAIELQHTALETLNIALDALHLRKVEGISQSKEEQVLIDAFTKSLYDEAAALTVVVGVQDTFNQVTAKVPALAAAATSAMQGLANASLDSLSAVGKAFATSGSTTSEAAYIAAGGFINSAGVGARPTAIKQFDTGGPVLQDGPIYAHAGEFVVPKGGSGGVTNIFNITQPLGTPAAIAAAVDEALMARQRNTGQRF
jgi:hypothetical protein